MNVDLTPLQLADTERRKREEAAREWDRRHSGFEPGYQSNRRITQRNGGVRPQFINDIGGCSENYR